MHVPHPEERGRTPVGARVSKDDPASSGVAVTLDSSFETLATLAPQDEGWWIGLSSFFDS
jgi:hypothetical protein